MAFGLLCDKGYKTGKGLPEKWFEMNKLYISLGVLLCLLTIDTQLHADALSLATDRSMFSDSASWTGTCFTSVSSLATTSNSGVGVTATGAGNITWTQQVDVVNYDPNSPVCPFPIDPYDNGDAAWLGNFGTGDGLVWSFDPNNFDPNNNGGSFPVDSQGMQIPGTGPIVLTFSQAVSGIGTQFEDFGNGPFTAILSAYNGLNLLGSFTISGSSFDSSAVFLGIIDQDGANITSAQLSIDGSCPDPGCSPLFDANNFAINQVSLTAAAAVPTPEPASILLLEAGLAGLALLKVRKMTP